MLTSRGWWLLFVILLQVTVGFLLADHAGTGPTIAMIGLVLLSWFSGEWLIFLIRTHFAAPKLKVRRVLKADGRVTPVIWAGQDFLVVVEITLDSKITLPYVVLQDRPPSGCDRVSGRDDCASRLTRENAATVEYSLRCMVPGEIRFEGVRAQTADFHGFFYDRRFVRQPAVYIVLPPLGDAEGNRRTTKSHNVLPPPGLHRLRQPGGGSELHDLRDYRPGDPPKMIAWKASARRDRLIIKEFESDVPVRCTLFVDTAQSVRLGPPRETMLNQITTIASGVAQAALSDRDHVGLVLFDDKKTEIMTPARNSRHLIQLLHRLAVANGAAPISPAADINQLMQLATPLALELYPDLMDRRINVLPLRMVWKPILDYRRSWLVLVPLMPFLILLGWTAALVASMILDVPEWTAAVYHAGNWAFTSIGSYLWPIFISACLALIAGIIWLIHGLSGRLPPWHGIRVQRKQLSALFAALDDAPLGTDARYLDDDDFFAPRLQQFLAQHHRRYPLALFDGHGRYLFRSRSKIDVLAKALLRSVAHGRDNELFVVLADLFELEDEIGPLLRAIRVASARHHQVMVICPWMPGVPAFDGKLSKKERSKRIRQQALAAGFRGIETQLFRQTAERYHNAFMALRREFGKSGVLMVRAEQHESVRLILNRMDRLRGTRARR